MKTMTLVMAGLAILTAPEAAFGSPALRPVTVREMIQRTYIDDYSLGASHEFNDRPVASFSPSRRRFIVATYSPDIARKAEIARLHLFESAQLSSRSAQDSDDLPHGRVVFTAEVRQDHERIRSIHWHSDSEISFLSPDSSGILQVFRGSVDQDRFEQVTNAASDIYQFAFAGDDLIYMEEVRPATERYDARIAASFMGTTLGEILEGRPGWGPGMPIVQLVRKRSSGGLERLPVPPMLMFPLYQQMYPAPSGKHLVLRYPAVDHPAHWSEYGGNGRFETDYSTQYHDGDRSPDPTSPRLQHRHRWMLLDLQSGEFRPLMDAPAAHVGPGGHGTVHWSRDSTTIIFTNTALPLSGVPDSERVRRRTSLAAAALHLPSGRLTPIAYFGAGEGRSSSPSAHLVAWLAEQESLLLPIPEQDGKQSFEMFRRSNAWQATRVDHPVEAPLKLELRQGLNSRPRLYAKVAECGCDRLVLDPDPQADSLSFARAEVFGWTDANGISWTGGLLRPIGYREGERYPLIVQTHGFDPDKLLLAGPSGATAAFAAQAFANAGFLVIQVQDQPDQVIPHDRPAPGYGEGYRSAIQALAEEGLADAERVGIIGFSATGLGTTYLLTHHPDMIAAATYADASTGEPYSGLMNLGLDNPHPAYGPTFKDIPMEQWWANNMLSRIQDSKAAVRLEAYSTDSAIAMWEPYALLKGYGRPAEFVYLPGSEHNPFNPAHRLISQGGTFDWMRFWLQGFEDPDPSKELQYERWRRLRDHAQGGDH